MALSCCPLCDFPLHTKSCFFAVARLSPHSSSPFPSTTDSLSGCSCLPAFADALFAWSLCSFPPVSLPALRCFVILSSVAPLSVLSRLVIPGHADQDEDKSNPPSCQPYSSFLEAVDLINKRDPDAALATLSMQLLINIIPACRFVLIIVIFAC